MNEPNWLTCDDPAPMLAFLLRNASARKLRLFAVACCHQLWPILYDRHGKNVVCAAEQVADGLISLRALDLVYTDAHYDGAVEAVVGYPAASGAAEYTSNATAAFAAAGPHYHDYRAMQADLLRHVIGNPFRPVSANPAWLTWNDGTVPRLAATIYAERAFDRMPILADAVEEAGCDNADLLNHCRQPSEHVRGCWVLDLLLGKS